MIRGGINYPDKLRATLLFQWTTRWPHILFDLSIGKNKRIHKNVTELLRKCQSQDQLEKRENLHMARGGHYFIREKLLRQGDKMALSLIDSNKFKNS